MTKLSVNINKIATLRNARGGNVPDLLQVAKKMNIKKAEVIIDQVHAAVGRWNEFAEQTKVKKDLKEAISKTLLLL